jgi:hypothetical protein
MEYKQELQELMQGQLPQVLRRLLGRGASQQRQPALSLLGRI